jgi:hypothetical protein
LVPPTDKNLLLYEKWAKEEPEKTEFFGDLAEGCCRIEIFAGIPVIFKTKFRYKDKATYYFHCLMLAGVTRVVTNGTGTTKSLHFSGPVILSSLYFCFTVDRFS